LRIHFFLPALAITVMWLIFKTVNVIFIKKKFDLKQEVVNLIYFISMMGIIGLTLFPLEIGSGPEYDSPNNFVPLASINELLNHFYFLVPLKNILGNIILFIPLGFILVLKFKRINNLLSVVLPFASINELLNHFYFLVPLKNILGNIILFIPLGFILVLKFKRINNLLSVVLVGVLSSTLIEFIQLLLPNRAFDIDDIILNALGSMIGFLILKATKIKKFVGFSSLQKQIN